MKHSQGNSTELHYKKMTETPVSKLVIQLGIPTTISMLITNLYNMVDTFFVGTLGKSPQGAIGVLFTLQCIIQAFAFMLGHGSGTFVSRELADKDVKKASEYISSAFFLGGALGIIFMIIGLATLTPFMRFLGSTETILPYAKQYGMWVLISSPFLVCSLILNNCLRYEGKAVFAMIGLVSGAVLNMLGDYIFVSVCSLGVFGAGMSTAISQIVSFIILLILYIRMAQSKISFKSISKSPKLYLDICRVGLPSLIRQGLNSISSGLLNNLAKHYGELQGNADAIIAAMSIVNRCSSFVMCVGLGIGQGLQPVASFNYQAKEYDRVKKALVVTCLIGLSVVITVALPLCIVPKFFISIFQKAPEVIEFGSVALRYAMIGLVFSPISTPVNMLYQSIQKSGIASFLSLLRSGLTFIPILILTTSLWGLLGIQIAQPIADVLTGLICLPFMLHFLFKTPKTEKALIPPDEPDSTTVSA